MIVVTAPTGAIGSQLLTHLLHTGEPLRVIARDPDRLGAAVRDRAEIVAGSHGDPDVVDRAFAGARTVFWLVPPQPGAASLEAAFTEFSRPAAAALRKHGVPRTVGVSALGRGTPYADEAGHVTATLAVDDLFAGTGTHYRALLLPSFMDNLLRQVEAIDQGRFFGPQPADLKSPTCAVRDIAAAAARLLTEPEWSGRGDVAVLGPQDVSPGDQAAIMSEVLGFPVEYQQVPYEQFGETMTARGYSAAAAQGMVDMARAKNSGLDAAEPRTPESSSPTGFRQWCAEVLAPAVRRVRV